MADLSNSSFIPKRSPTSANKRGGSVKRVYVFTLISYIIMFATLLGAGVAYLYGSYVDEKFHQEVITFNEAANSFSEADMERVKNFDLRLTEASDRLDSSVSVVSIFEALEAATARSVALVSLELKREDDEKFLLSATVETDSFDSTIFQRSVYGRNQLIESAELSDVTYSISGGEDTSEPSESVASFSVELGIPVSAVPYTVKELKIPPTPTPSPASTTEPVLEEVSESEVQTESVDNNQEII